MTYNYNLQELLEQLPFYVNGTIDDLSRARMDGALAKYPELRDALEQERELKTRVTSGTEEMLTQLEPHFDMREAALLARVAATNTQPAMPTAQAEPQKQGRASALSFLNPRNWTPALALSFAAAAAIIGTQSITIGKLEKENFELASGGSGQPDRSQGIVIEIKDDASWKDVTVLLDSEALTIAESGAFGVLTVRGDKKDGARNAVIERLKKSPLIIRAEPEA